MRSRRSIIAALAVTLAASGLLSGTGALGQEDQAADPSTALPQHFTARLACGLSAGGESGTRTELPDDPGTTALTQRLEIWRFDALEVSDPRMDGRVYGHLAGTEWSNESWADEIGVYSALWHVVNDGGEWIGPYATLRAPEIGYATHAIRLEGRGGYEGQYAIIEADFRDDCGWDVTGYILERDLPDSPEPLAALSQ